MKLLLLTFFLCAALNSLKAQKFDKKLLDEKVTLIDSAFRFRQTMYVINGIPFSATDSIKIDSALQANGLKYLVSIDILKEEARNSMHSNNDVVLVTFAYNQKLKRKRELLKNVRNSFVDNYVSFSQHIFTDAKDPVLYIDNVLIHHTEAKEKLKALTLKSIYHIDYKDKKVAAEHYGQNAKNGHIRIWTVPK
ncbi:hypothetical protein [Parasegetibacter sp. NRK P23]|uniref:hypothetical protein n=1 Tax=Parasegetibacter sp. NRK P23 TaxID=2942999 RepID=UPI0020440FCC|nr:hypothetical protein [Parasegetibacter sp. NRK P23]MCM5530255.1 hypothetical protein [Parasegetibacter sp. NRK P23]